MPLNASFSYLRRRRRPTAAVEALEVRLLMAAAGGPLETQLIGRAADGTWWNGAGAGGPTETRKFATWDPSVDWRDVTAADFDGDGLDDVAGRDAATGAWWVSLSDGAGATTRFAGLWSPGAGWSDVAAVDLAGPGDRSGGGFTNKADLVGRAADGMWWAAVSNGDGTFTTVPLIAWAASAGWRDVRFLDFNDDGATDILGRTADGEWWAARSLSRIYGGEGLAYEYDLLARWDESAGWRDVVVADQFFQWPASGTSRPSPQDSGVLARTADGAWYGLRFNARPDRAVTESLGVWHAAAGWRDVMSADVFGHARDAIVGRASDGTWWASRWGWSGPGLISTAFAVWDPTVSWADVRVVDLPEEQTFVSEYGYWEARRRDAVAGRATDGTWWLSGSTVGTRPVGKWNASAGWRDVAAAHVRGAPVVVRPVVELGGDRVFEIAVYAGRAGAEVTVRGAAGAGSYEVDHRSLATGAVETFSVSLGAGTTPVRLRFDGHVAADSFRNASSLESRALGRGGDDRLDGLGNGAFDRFYGGDGVDELLGDPGDALDKPEFSVAG